ncbi:MAG: hypothetical protein PHAS_00796 [Phascolarctobacterium sp.]|jgi:hypothetical protein
MGVHMLSANIFGSGLIVAILGTCWWLVKH